MTKRPFEGIKILDFTWMGVGPSTMNYIIFHGATAIKVESSIRPDPLRFVTPYKDGMVGANRGYYFAFTHAVSRMDITLNLSHPKGVELAKKLVSWADIVSESFTAGTMQKIGLGYEELKKIKPDIIMLSTCMHGQTGPMAKHPGTGFVLTALSGFDNIVGWPDRPPCGLYGPFTDMVAPLFNAVYLIAALDYRRRTGKGMHIDLSQHEAGIHCLSPLVLDYVVNKREPKAEGNHMPYASPHGIYRCQGNERWCAIAVFTDEEWQCFCRVIGNPDWTRESRFATLTGRKQNEDELDRLVEEWTSKHTAEEVMTLMQKAGVGAGIASNLRDLTADPQLAHYQCFKEIDHPEMGKNSFYHPPGYTLSRAAHERGRPPMIGESNEHVYTELLGIPDEEYVQLLQDGVFE
jgi:benzylsuccinate CoA-transferase BbsF subunit